MTTQRLISSVSSLAILFCCTSLLPEGCFSSVTTGIKVGGIEKDRQALLTVKSQFHDDPLGVTSSWNNSVAFCLWKGITCGRRHQRITKLDLSQQQLRGTLSPHIGNLSFLRFINLGNNSLYGFIPPELGRLSRLQSLNLANNSFTGMIPVNLSNCSKLTKFIASRNHLVGSIPAELGSLPKLEILHIGFNNLTGRLPSSLGNVSTLQYIFLGVNNLQGNIPNAFCLLKRLAMVYLYDNNFSGFIDPFYNSSSLESLNVQGNQLYGSLPDNLGSIFPNLRVFFVGANNFSGTLPVFISNASKLEIFDVSKNFLSGKVSINFEETKSLKRLNLEVNNLGRDAAEDLDFITTLTNRSKLKVFSIAFNQFGGQLPNSLTNLSTALTRLVCGGNRIRGTIPSGIANLVNLIDLGLESNQLEGTIPHSLGKLKRLQALYVDGNNLVGRIPISLGNLSLLSDLALGKNYLEGPIPPTLGKCQILRSMWLQGNRLTGSVPREIFNITTLSLYLDLSYNILTGSFPSEVGSLSNLVELSISNNQFSNQIPSTLGACTSLQILDLSSNSFNGSIPASLSSLRSIEVLDLSSNNLSGQIPEYFEQLTFLNYLNLSNNHFEGKVPTKGILSNATAISLAGNEKLCGGIAELHLPLCHFKRPRKPKKTPSILMITCGVIGFLLLSVSFFCWLRNKKATRETTTSALPLTNSVLQISYQQLFKATDGFSPNNLIGQGSFGDVYCGIFGQNQEQSSIAVKVMKLEYHGASKSFITECEALRNVRHRNLVKIISACSSIDFQGNAFKALIYEFMPNGSLEGWLHPLMESNNSIAHGAQRILNFLQRLNIAIDVASALDYLHQHCNVPIVHCDLKPSNILLDHDMVGHVVDFGLARFFPKSMNKIPGDSISTLGLWGTVGYAAPEYGIGSEATTIGDMYSYGILLLEMFTGKRPTDEMFKDGLTLHSFTKMALPDRVLDVIDPLLLAGAGENSNVSNSKNPSKGHNTGCLISILRVGIACSVESPEDRMNSAHAAKELHFIRDNFLDARTHTQS